ncbi:MAG: serine/threonine protein kinase, partial [Polyangiaceae bacterium]|nr:serine/threonine protein kinase [Polyangiaceae bacterium]
MEPGIEEGTLLDDRYRVGRKIGEGGMGAVFEGENTILHRPVAIKALRPQLALDDEALARFQREAEVTSSLNHPHIVAVLDMNFRAPPYIVMELLEGESLRARLLREGTVAQARCLVIATQLLSALAESHARGILHRDVKPANVFLATNAAVGFSTKLLDFGIAKLTELKAGNKRITHPSHIVGSGAYMSPEQIMAQPLGPATDIFSVGVLLYEALSGAKPFVGDDVTVTMARIVAAEPPPAIEGVLPPLMKIILRALAREPKQRFESAQEMSKALEPLLPRFSAMNLHSPLVMEDRTVPI